MKFLLSIFFLMFSEGLSAQVDNYIIGTYETHSKATDGSFELKRSITLNADGTFIFHNYRMVDIGIPPETNLWGMGNWKGIKNQIYFSWNKDIDIDEKFTLNFKNTKARYKTKSPGDISGKDIKTSLIFFDSDIFWVKGMELFKKED